MTACIISIRPQPDADLDVAALARRNVRALACPLMAPTYLSSAVDLDVTGCAGVIFTSRHAVEGFVNSMTGTAWQALTAYCVGRATARRATQAGFTRIMTGQGGGRGLAPLIRDDTPAMLAPLLWPSAAQISFDMVAELAPDIDVRRVPVYEMSPVNSLSPLVLEALQESQLGGVIMMSARSASLFHDALDAAGFAGERRNITVIAGSQAIADAAGKEWKDCLVARRPTRARLLAIASLLYHRRLT